MARKNIEDVYNILYKMLEDLDKLGSEANDLVSAVSAYGGDLKRVITEQMAKYFIPAITSLKTDTSKPGCIKAQLDYLDSIPLWQTRIEPDPAANYQPDVENLPQTDPNVLPASSSVDTTAEVPLNASFNNPQGIQQNQPQAPQETQQAPVQESLKESYTRFFIKRRGMKGDSLGNGVAKFKDHTVAEFDTLEDANRACRKYNKAVTPGEKELLGTEYYVDEVNYNDQGMLERK